MDVLLRPAVVRLRRHLSFRLHVPRLAGSPTPGTHSPSSAPSHSISAERPLFQDAKFLPFICPMDHVLSPKAWAEAAQPYRDASFLSDHRFTGQPVQLSLIPREEFNSLISANSTVLPFPVCYQLDT